MINKLNAYPPLPHPLLGFYPHPWQDILQGLELEMRTCRAAIEKFLADQSSGTSRALFESRYYYLQRESQHLETWLRRL